ncbi:MFS transporter [Ktedonobacter sp. SOSP1-52]|uniref:MFS transporter n=1 Tax=Ktedonobacter sp. SOSP1-52 TaxID=2778366 RepID=UPI001916BA54|nr:MFS transporter [Ktedonobacter sp. SOSP1-52]GHO70829.1 MFS transporter [Ktedonobacter sp. SOSP1-52]
MWFRILVLAIGGFALGTNGFVVVGILPEIAHELHVPIDLVGQLETVFALTYALGAPVLAAVAGNIARKRLLLFGLLLVVMMNLLATAIPNLAVLFVTRMLSAIGAALYTPTASSVAASLAPEEKRGRALALAMAGLTLAMVLGVPLGIFISSTWGWHMTFAFIACLSGLAFLGILVLFPAIANPPKIGLRTRLTLLRRPVLLVTLLNTAPWVLGYFIIYTYLSSFLQQVTHLDGVGISKMFLLFGLAGIVGNALAGYSTDRWGAMRTLVLASLALGLILCAFPYVATSFAGAAVLILIWGVFDSMTIPPQQHRLLALTTEIPGVILSLNSSVIYLSSAGGSALGGLLIHFTSLTALGWVGGICQFLALGVLFWSSHLMNKAQQKESKRKEEPCPASMSVSQ